VTLALLKLLLGLILLVAGAEFLINACIKIARSFNIPPMVIGLTIVAFGTSAPEMGVSVMAALNHNPDIAIGNIVGSNLANIGLIMGIGALVAPLKIPKRTLRIEVPFLLASVVFFGGAAITGSVGRVIGVILVSVFIFYLYYLYRLRKAAVEPYQEIQEGDAEHVRPSAGTLMLNGGLIVLCILALVYGSRFLLSGAVFIATYFHCPELIIGLTVTAIGTSLPELATTFSAARHGHGELVVGNVLGSNLANVYLVLGTTGLIYPVSVNPDVVLRDLPVMALFTIAIVPMMRSGWKVSRREGGLLLAAYLVYTALLYIFKT